MTLHDFIKKYIARNTMIRLWKEIESYSHYMLTDDAVMEWETLNIEELSDVEVVCITDIVCERNKEAVNIVVNTELTRDDIVKLFRNYEKRRGEERRFVCEGGGRMSITDAIKDMEKHMGIDTEFSDYMNAPLPHNNQGYVQRDYKTGIDWVCCPYCGRKNFQITEKTKISNLSYPCKNTKCKKIFEVNID